MTPPVGIYARSWGAATHEVAEGVHRPLTATAAVFAPIDGDGPELALVALDIGWFQYAPDERGAARRRSWSGPASREDAAARLDCRTRTPARTRTRSSPTSPGVELIQPYLDALAEHIADAILEARRRRAPALDRPTATAAAASRPTAISGTRTRALRLRLQPRRAGRRHAARRARDRRRRRHPRDALQLRLPPDDARLGQPPALARLHRRRARGARARLRRPGALPPRRLGRARPARRLRRRHGRRRPQRAPARPRGRRRDRGAAAAGHALRLHGHRRLGRQPRHLGVPAVRARRSSPGAAASRRGCTDVRAATQGRASAIVESLTDATPDAVQEREKALRRAFLELALGDGPSHRMPLWTWRLGEALLVAVPNELYSVFQIELRAPLRGRAGLRPDDDERRRRLPLPARELRQRPLPGAAVALRAGCLEEAIEAAAAALGRL